MPYIYLIEEGYRENFNINFENSVIIFDEAHNVPQTCEDAASFSIDTKNLDLVISELNEFQKHKKRYQSSANRQPLQSTDDGIFHLKSLTQSFKNYMLAFNLQSQ